jgi:hypothetical protein
VQRVSLVVLKGKEIVARVSRATEQLADLPLSHVTVRYTTIARLGIHTGEVSARYEVNYATDGVRTVSSARGIGKNIYALYDTQRNVGDVVKRTRGAARRNTVTIDQNKRRSGIEPPNIDTNSIV